MTLCGDKIVSGEAVRYCEENLKMWISPCMLLRTI